MSEAASRPELDEEDLRQVRQIFEWVRTGMTEGIVHVLRQGLPPNLLNEKGDSLLMLAAYHGHVDTVRALLDAGADPELRNDRAQTPMAGAAFKGYTEVVRVLLEHGAKPDTPVGDGKTALFFAAMFNRTEIMELLLAHGADIEARDAMGIGAAEAARATGASAAADWLDAKRGVQRA